MPDVMEVAVATEAYGQAFYEALAERFAMVPDIARLFHTLSRDEASHRDQFAALRSRVQRFEALPSKERAMRLQANALEEFFHEDIEDKVRRIDNAEDALALVLQLERSTLAFYESMQETIGPDPTLQALIRAEKRHVEVVSRAMMTGAKLRSVDDDFTGKQPEGSARQDARLHATRELSDEAK